MHAVILVVLKCLFILVCRSKSPAGLMLHVVQYSTQNKISMSSPLLRLFQTNIIIDQICSLKYKLYELRKSQDNLNI